MHEQDFYKAVETRTLEINNEPNPFPFVCAARSLILAAKLNFWLGARLSRFIHALMESTPVSELSKAQMSHYGQMRCPEETMRDWLSNIRSQLETGHDEVLIQITPESQRHLWEDWPPTRAFKKKKMMLSHVR